jgi:hypothetical protein
MPTRLGRFLSICLCFYLYFLGVVHGSKAETAYSVSLTVPDSSNFPFLTTFLDVHDSQGAFVHGLTLQDVTLLENDLPIPASELEEQKPGVQFVIAITPGESFSIQDALGISRYEYLLQGLLAGTWVDQQPGLDDFSLLTLGGPQITHSPNPKVLRSSLEGYLPDTSQSTSSLEVLASALQVVSDPTDRPGMERVILFITPPQSTEISLGLQSIIASALQQDIHIFVWMVGSREVFDFPEAELLENLANQTQGAFFAFNHDEAVPDLESILEPFRYIYHLGYNSQIFTAGSQHLAAQVTVGGIPVTSGARSFELDLQAPVPMLLDLPEEIVRTFDQTPTPGLTGADANLMPAEQMISIKVEFPDGYDRPLTRTVLYIDNILYSENTNPPYDQFTWDLRSYNQDSVYALRVEAVDSLGISGSSAEKTVKIIVPTTTQGMMLVFSQKRPFLVGMIAIIITSILVLVLIIGGRIRPKPHPGQGKPSVDLQFKTHPAGYQARVSKRKEPVTQPVKMVPHPPAYAIPLKKSWRERLPWLKPERVPAPAIAYLIPLQGTGEPTLPEPLAITADETTIGRDPLQVNLVIAARSIENLHARIHHEGQSFLIFDAGSVAGTWVNYKPVPPTGTPLEHADIIHLGQVGLRFSFPVPVQLREIVVTPLEPEQ